MFHRNSEGICERKHDYGAVIWLMRFGPKTRADVGAIVGLPSNHSSITKILQSKYFRRVEPGVYELSKFGRVQFFEMTSKIDPLVSPNKTARQEVYAYVDQDQDDDE
jgi:hypothetical protein